ncbi:hypothetical protein FE257_010691 [Aspergillus nanangensis]|uniref:Major facilitator superfamily (MFS) profile domain-containing protein n=1 Tax=Aspergillus nanangensis TaxID=2582783 RepID=A0AAD4CI74_ASPNN|nr:hypothetical protein FE257_010691 [Aspergillus nanangensis]
MTKMSGIEHENGLPPRYFRSTLFLGSLTAIDMGLLAAIAGFAFAAPILSLINQDIGPSPDLSWVSLTYTLTIAVGLTLIGRTTDIFGRRYIFIGGGILGTVGSIVCARAGSINTMIGGMTLIGLAASTQVSYFYVVGELVPMKYRFAANGLMYIFTTPGGAFAPAIATAFANNTPVGWRGVFYVLFAINLVALLCFAFFYWPPAFHDKHADGTVRSYLRQFDYVGVVLFVGGLLTFLMGLSWGGTRYPWASANVIGTIVVGGFVFCTFIAWECFAPLHQRLVPMRLLRNIPWTAAVVTSGLGSSLYYGLAVVWPSMVSIVYATRNPVNDSMAASLVGAAWLLGEITSGFMATPVRHIKLQSIITLTVSGVLLACVATCTVDTRTRACVLVAFGTFFAGWLEGLSLTITTLALGNQDELGTACGFGGSIRYAITTVINAIYNSILAARLATTVPQELSRSAIQTGLSASIVQDVMTALAARKLPTSVPGITNDVGAIVYRAYQIANIDAYRTIFYTTIAVTGLGLISCFMLPNTDELMVNTVTTPLGRNNIGRSRTDADDDMEKRNGHSLGKI